ncbi:hypothetical protein [Mesorhizobium sp. 8]|uniref:hypothetical protein n=1 Tax=Mesorhizobium sp. 8 TaxID=2584466 RepID=UPI001122DF3C|nr:hypothetical protein [Mesorhizobium sp. 8]QDC02727.1 hypothetical protein FGU64_21160 [Mesorhizobium sp. 8]
MKADFRRQDLPYPLLRQDRSVHLSELVAAGHEVIALAQSDAAAAKVTAHQWKLTCKEPAPACRSGFCF